MTTIATLDGIDLPLHFSYRPYIQRKRNSITPTVNGVVVQAASPQIVHGDGILAWNMEAAFKDEFQFFLDKYNTVNLVLYPFTGYWGETLQVYFTNFDSPEVRGQLFNLSGSFQVIEVTTDITGLTC